MFLSQIVLSGQSGEVSPVVGVIFVVAIVAVTLLAMKAESKKAIKMVQEKFAGRILEECSLKTNFGYSFVTEEEFVLQSNQNVFKVFRLDSIRYVYSHRDQVLKSWAFAVMDEDKKVLKGEITGGTKVAKAMNQPTVFPMPKEEAERICQFVMKHAPHVERL